MKFHYHDTALAILAHAHAVATLRNLHKTAGALNRLHVVVLQDRERAADDRTDFADELRLTFDMAQGLTDLLAEAGGEGIPEGDKALARTVVRSIGAILAHT